MYDITTSSGDFFANGVLVHNCDAYYTWDKNSREFWTESRPVEFSKLALDIQGSWRGSSAERRVVWTGGEPLMQKKQIDEVMQWLWTNDRRGFWYPEIETNGTVMPTQLQLENYQFNVSPKLANSGNSQKKCIKPKVLEALVKANSTFKFVCRDFNDLEEILAAYKDIPLDRIIIMPEGVIEEEISRHARQLADPCKEYGLRLLPRLQAIAFDGAKRGV